MLATVSNGAGVDPFIETAIPTSSPSRSLVSSVMVLPLKPKPKLLVFETSISSDSSTVLLGPSESVTRVNPVIPVPTTLTALTTPLASLRTIRSVAIVSVFGKIKLMISSAATVIVPVRLTRSSSIPSAATLSPSATPFFRTAAPTSCPS